MKKGFVKVKKFFIMISVFLLGIVGVSCSNKMVFETEHYTYIKYSDRIAIRKLTDKGKTQTELIIPDQINGKPVTHIGEKTMGTTYTLISSELKILNLPQTVTSFTNMSGLSALESLIFNSTAPPFFTEDPHTMFGLNAIVTIYVPKGYSKLVKESQSFSGYKFEDANISFMSNYEGSCNNGFYFIHQIRLPNKITAPNVPERAGHIFTGWYTDATCQNAFDFSSEINTEITLFAGWKTT